MILRVKEGRGYINFVGSGTRKANKQAFGIARVRLNGLRDGGAKKRLFTPSLSLIMSATAKATELRLESLLDNSYRNSPAYPLKVTISTWR